MTVDLVLGCGFFVVRVLTVFLLIFHFWDEGSHRTKNIFEQPLLLCLINVCLE